MEYCQFFETVTHSCLPFVQTGELQIVAFFSTLFLLKKTALNLLEYYFSCSAERRLLALPKHLLPGIVGSI